MTKEKSLTDMLNEEETTVSGILYSYLSSNEDNRLDNNILGLQEVRENVKKALFKAKFAASLGYIPILVLTGPSGSGKTEIINSLIDSYYDAVLKTGGIYTLSVNGTRCQYKENPHNILRSKIPLKLESLGISETRDCGVKTRPTMCDACRSALEVAVSTDKNTDGMLGVKQFFPDISNNIELGDKKLQDRLYSILSKSNRGILILSADKSNIENISEASYQLLINLYDNMLSDRNGGNIPLDMLIILHGNEEFMERLKSDDRDFSRPLKERMIPVQVRRILSYSEEEKLYKRVNLPFMKMARNSLRYLSTFSILSRITDTELDYNHESVRYVLDSLDIYDSGKLDSLDFSKIPRSLETYLTDMNYSRQVKDTILSLIMEGDTYVSGWSKGMSFRRITSLLKDSEKSDLRYTDIFSFINNNESAFDGADDAFATAKDYIRKMVVSDVNTDVDSAVMSFLAEKNGIDYGTAVSVLEKTLNQALDDNVGIKTTPEEDHALIKLKEYMDVEVLNEYLPYYKDDRAIPSEEFNVKLDPLLRYSYFKNPMGEFVIRDEGIFDGLGDKKSDLYQYVSGFLGKKYGYWDSLTEEAINIYREGPAYYPEIGDMN